MWSVRRSFVFYFSCPRMSLWMLREHWLSCWPQCFALMWKCLVDKVFRRRSNSGSPQGWVNNKVFAGLRYGPLWISTRHWLRAWRGEIQLHTHKNRCSDAMFLLKEAVSMRWKVTLSYKGILRSWERSLITGVPVNEWALISLFLVFLLLLLLHFLAHVILLTLLWPF